MLLVSLRPLLSSPVLFSLDIFPLPEISFIFFPPVNSSSILPDHSEHLLRCKGVPKGNCPHMCCGKSWPIRFHTAPSLQWYLSVALQCGLLEAREPAMFFVFLEPSVSVYWMKKKKRLNEYMNQWDPDLAAWFWKPLSLLKKIMGFFYMLMVTIGILEVALLCDTH